MSVNHQFIEFSESVLKRYKKTIIGMLTGKRLDPHRPENRMDWLLQSPERDFKFSFDENDKTRVTRSQFSYEDEIIEIYSPTELKVFQSLNRSAIEAGILVEYDLPAPEINTTNILSATDVDVIASTKQNTALKKRLMSVTSVHSLDRILTAAIEKDRPLSIIETIKSRINELSRDTTS